MTVVGIAMVKDEADIISDTLAHMSQQVDHIIVADNGSTDGTREELEGAGIEVVDDFVTGYYQSEKMSALAERARLGGATFVVPFDADEFWRPRTGDTISQVLMGLPDEALVADAVVFDHVAVDGEVLSPWRREEILPLRKVAVRAVEGVTIHQGNHGATFPDHPTPLTVTGQLAVSHFPYRSAAQMIRKARNGAAAYAATDLPESVGQHWRDYGRLSDDQLTEVFHGYFWSADPETDGLVYDPMVPCPALES